MGVSTELPCLTFVANGVAGLRPYEPGMPIDELRRQMGIDDVVKLASNENPSGPSPRVIDAVRSYINESTLSLYPDGGGFRLKRKLAEFHDIEPERITLGNGSNDILEFVSRVFLAPDRVAMFSAYAFAVYPIVTQAQGARALVIDARSAHDSMALGHDLAAFSRALDEHEGVSVVFIANPNNPTGTWVQPSDLEAFMDRIPARTIVVLDEAYHEYQDPALRVDSRRLLEQFSNLVVTRTFSKAYGLAGLRVGYSLSSPVVADLFNRVRQPFNMNSVALFAAEVALEDQDHVRRSVALNASEKTRLCARLVQLGIRLLPSQTNFLTAGFGRDCSALHHALLERGIIVRPMGSYGLPEYLRITVGTVTQNDRFLEALTAVLDA